VKVSAIIESVNYDTLTVDELFSKLKSTEINYQTQTKIKTPLHRLWLWSQVTTHVL
jgi:hypothetical protein